MLGQVGAGGMGSVYRVRDRLTRQIIALKHMTTPRAAEAGQQSGNTDLRLAMMQEFRMLASLRHPNIISVLDYGFDEHRLPYFTMELLEGGVTILEAGRGRPLDEQIDLVVQVLQALVYLHRHSIIHRDLKPANVLVVDQQVKLLDFGLAVVRGHVEPEDRVVGTLGYLAPELITGRPASAASDLYAVGIMAYELFTGEHPFKNGEPHRIIDSILHQPADLTPLDDTPAVRDVVARLIAKDPADRYRSAYEPVLALAQATGLPLQLESTAAREGFIQSAKFVGRELELHRLSEALEDTLAGMGSAWLVAGESGVGKSRLLEELRTLALVKGAMVLYGEGISEGRAPYRLWREVVRRLCLHSPVSRREAAILRRLIPDIEDITGMVVPDLPELEARAAQDRVGQVIEELFKRQQEPVVVLLEDLHWVTPRSLAVMHRLSKVIGRSPVLIIGTYRDDETPRLPEQLPGVPVIRLRRLTRPEIATLSASMLGKAGRQRQVVDLLEHETEGNVFFMVEVVRALAEEAGRLEDIGRKPLPESVFAGGMAHIIRRRLNRVPPEHQPWLRLAAVVGRDVDLNIMQTLLPGKIEDRLNAGAEAAVLEVEEGHWRFAHNKLREALLADIDPDERRGLHHRVALALEQVYPDSPGHMTDLMYHWGMAGEPRQEMRYAIRAGENAFRLHASQEARQYFNRALELARAHPLESGELEQLYTHYGRVLELSNRYRQALDCYEALLEISRERDERHLELVAIANMAALLASPNTQYNSRRGFDLAYRGLGLARELGDGYSEARMLRCLLALSLYAAREADAAIAYGQEALRVARVHDLRQQIALALNDLARVYVFTGRFSDAEATLGESASLWPELDDIPLMADNLSITATQQFFLGHYDRAVTCSDLAYQLSESIDYAWGQSDSRVIVGNVYLRRGEFDLAIDTMADCIRQSVRAGHNAPLITTRSEMALACAMLGDYTRAVDLLVQARAATSTSLSLQKPSTHGLEAWIPLPQGNLDVARALIAGLELPDFHYALGITAQVLAEVETELLLADGDPAGALARIDAYLAVVEPRGERCSLPVAYRLRGIALDRLGRPEDALAALDTARHHAVKMGALADLWPVLADLNTVKTEMGDSVGADEALLHAQSVIEAVADSIAEANQRRAFLWLPQVVDVMGR